MKFEYFKINNFLSFGSNFCFDCNDALNIIVGANNSGKTNLFRTVTFLSEILRNRNLNYVPYYHNGDEGNIFEIRIGLNLNREEVQAITDYLILTLLKEQQMRPRTEDNKEILKEANDKIAYLSEIFFNRLLSAPCEILIRSYANTQYAPNIFFTIGDTRKVYYEFYGGRFTLNPTNNYSQTNFKQLFIDELREKYPNIFEQSSFPELAEKISNILSELDINWLITKLDSSINGTPLSIGIQSFSFNNFIVQEQEQIILKRLRNFLHERNCGKDEIDLLQIIRSIFESSIVRLSDVRSYNKEILPEDFDSIPTNADLNSGAELATILFKLKNSSNHKERYRYEEIKNSFRQLTGSDFDVALHTRDEIREAERLGLFPLNALNSNQQLSGVAMASYAPDTKVVALDERPQVHKINEISIYVVTNPDYQVNIEYAAAGYFETLLILFLITEMRNKTIFLDEPALNLHPTKQKEILERIINSSSSNQIFVITHSPYFIDYRYLDNTTRFALEQGKTLAYKLNLGNESVENWFNKELVRSPKFSSLLFANKVLLVEGKDEEAGLPIWLQKLNLSIEEHNIQIISIDGDNRYNNYAKVLSSFKISYKFIGDKKAITKATYLPENVLIYQKGDFTQLYLPELLEKAKEIFGEYVKDPGIAMYVAENSAPPEEIMALAPKLEEFIRA